MLSKLIGTVLTLLMLTMSCIPKKEAVPVAELPEIEFDGKSNPELLMSSLFQLDTDFKDLPVSPRSSILVASLEHLADTEANSIPVAEPDQVTTMVQDALVIHLNSADYQVPERDFDILTRLYHESLDKYVISIAPDLQPNDLYKELLSYFRDEKSFKEGKEGTENYVAKKIVDTFLPAFHFINTPYVRHPFLGKAPLQDKHKLKSADFILAFRVFECGVRYRVIPERAKGVYPQVERTAKTQLHLRLVDAKTGHAVWAKNTTGIAKENTPKMFLTQIEKSDYKFFGFERPMIPRANIFLDQNKLNRKEEETTSGNPLTFLKKRRNPKNK